MLQKTVEVNFDGLIGPTHNYAGLAHGNLASQAHRSTISNPRAAALQGLAKMKFLADLGVKQAVLLPQERPDFIALRRIGFKGSDAHVLECVKRDDPVLLASCCSASSMWAANAATVSPSADTEDGRVHFTPANLVSQFHRSLEASTTSRVLRAIFPDESKFAHHAPLPAAVQLGDEGAANHIRLAMEHGKPGIELFVYGRAAFDPSDKGPVKYPARQTREASESISRVHELKREQTVFIRQNPAAIDAGAFHNDVVALGNLNLLMFHELAFADPASAQQNIFDAFARVSDVPVHLITVSRDEVPLVDAVKSYLFNSQLVSLPNGGMAMICPRECEEISSTRDFLARLMRSGSPVQSIHFVDVRESMNNGGGPACLRLRVVLTEAELSAALPGVFLTDALYAGLVDWVKRHYRDRLHPDDLADVKLVDESRSALDELTRLLGIGNIYPFQNSSQATLG